MNLDMTMSVQFNNIPLASCGEPVLPVSDTCTLLCGVPLILIH